MSNKTLALALLLSVNAVAFAQTAPTYADIRDAAMALKLQEYRSKLKAAQAKEAASGLPGVSAGEGAPALPPPLPAVQPPASSLPSTLPVPAPKKEEEEKIQLVAIYGVGDKLNAELLYNGSTHTVRAVGRNSKVGPWTVESVTPYHVALVKPGPKGKKGEEGEPIHREIHLSSDSGPDDNAAQNRNAVGGLPGLPMSIAGPFGNVPAGPVPAIR
jgi:hypothetical protein